MQKTLPLLLASVLLAACGGGTPTPVLTTLTIQAPNGRVKIGDTPSLTVTGADQFGNSVAVTPATWSSDQPNVIGVNQGGTLTVRHLDAVPVTLSVASAGVQANVKLSSYGLDSVSGSYNVNDANTYTVTYFAFRGADGSALPAATPVSIQGPSGWNGGNMRAGTLAVGTSLSSTWVVSTNTAPLGGTYTATLTSGGVTYASTSAISDPSAVLPAAATVISYNGGSYTASGPLPSGAASIFGTIYTSQGTVATTSNITATPASGTLSATVPAGTYSTGIYASSFPVNSKQPFPEQGNRSFRYTGTVTF